MLRAYLLIFSCLFLSFVSQLAAADNPAAPNKSSAPSPQDLEAVFVMADQGDASSQNYLGFLYATGQTVAKDEKAAFGWFHKAADQGHPEAAGNLAMLYEKGLGIAKNLHMALNLHRQAAMAGYAISMKRLASLYETGFPGEERDPVKAEMWKHRYQEALKATGASDTAPRQAAEKSSAPAEKSALTKLATPSAPPPSTPAKGQAAAPPASPQAKPALAASAANAVAPGKPYFFQVGGKATARETLEVTQKIVEKNLLPQNKRIELVNPDGKSYRINIGPFNDVHEAAPYKAKIMAFLNPTPPSEPTPPPPPASLALAATPLPSTQTVARPPEKPLAAASKPLAPLPGGASAPPAPTPASVKIEEKQHYVEVSGKATAGEATELLQKIVAKGMLPKNMHVELISPETDNYRIRIGPFADANEVAPQIAKINASIKSIAAPANMELVPVTPAHKPAPPPQKQENALLQPPPGAAPAPKLAVAGAASLKPAEETGGGLSPTPPKPAAKAARGRYYFIQPNSRSTFADSMVLVQSLFIKELVQETRRVRIENLDGQSYRVSVGPFSEAKEAQQQLQKIHQQTSQALSVAALEKHAAVAGEGEHQLFIQINAQGTLDYAVTLVQTLVEKELLAPKMFAEIVNFGAGNYRVRYGPFAGVKEGDMSIQNLKKQLKVSPLMINLERLVPADGK